MSCRIDTSCIDSVKVSMGVIVGSRVPRWTMAEAKMM
jgi:hypothetical protein